MKHHVRSTKVTDEEIAALRKKDSFTVVGVDSSLNSPGFARIVFSNKDNSVVTFQYVRVDNRKIPTQHYGAKLNQTAIVFDTQFLSGDVYLIERGFSRFAAETQSIWRVVGVLEQHLWSARHKIFCPSSPMTVKKIVTGNAKATKAEVSEAVQRYLGEQDFESDDQSDACAVALAFLIEHKFLPQKGVGSDDHSFE